MSAPRSARSKRPYALSVRRAPTAAVITAPAPRAATRARPSQAAPRAQLAPRADEDRDHRDDNRRQPTALTVEATTRRACGAEPSLASRRGQTDRCGPGVLRRLGKGRPRHADGLLHRRRGVPQHPRRTGERQGRRSARRSPASPPASTVSSSESSNIVGEGDVVLTERVDAFFTPTHTIELPVMGTFEVVGGKISAWRDYFDLNQFMSQLPAT